MKDGLMLHEYQELLTIVSKPQFRKMRASFSCQQNRDIEYFIQNECSKYERAGNTRNYFLIDPEDFKISAFFTLSLHSLILDELFSDLSPSAMEMIRGYGRRSARSVGCYLIGQLARNDRAQKSDITGSEMLSAVKAILADVKNSVGGRFTAVACADVLIPFYMNNGFVHLNRHSTLNTMVMTI